MYDKVYYKGFTHFEFRLLAAMQYTGEEEYSARRLADLFDGNYYSIYRSLEKLSKQGAISKNMRLGVHSVTYSLNNQRK